MIFGRYFWGGHLSVLQKRTVAVRPFGVCFLDKYINFREYTPLKSSFRILLRILQTEFTISMILNLVDVAMPNEHLKGSFSVLMRPFYLELNVSVLQICSN